jgi:hypothetical protein
MSRTGRTLVAVAGAALVLVVATWFDNTFMRDAVRHAQANFEMGGLGSVIAVGSMLVAGSVLLVGVLAWRAASVAVGVAYALAGGFLVMLPWIVWNFATQVNDTPPVLPEPLLSVVSEIYFRTAGGSLNAVGTIGAAMLIAGVAALVRWQRERAAAKGSVGAMSPATGPTLP